MTKTNIFRIHFINQDTTYEMYAKQVSESSMFGFIEVEEFVFGETSSVVVDPSEERLKLEFAEVKRTYIPMHSILRIDEVNKEGVAKAYNTGKVSHLPNKNFTPPPMEKK